MPRLLAITLAAVVLTCTVPSEARYRAPRRSIEDIAYAISTVRTGLAEPTRRTWAKILVDVARKHNFDPLTGWAIIAHESHWYPGRVGGGKDIGLGQVRYTESRRCKDQRLDSAPCLAWRQALHDPATNMAAMAGAITHWRKTCKTITGKSDLKHVLQGYGGFSKWPSKTPRLCGRHKVKGRWQDLPIPEPVADILRMRRDMSERISRRSRR